MKFFKDTFILFKRTMKHILRSPDTIMTVTITPIVFMLLFVYVFGGAISTNADVNYVTFILPGILLITVASGISYTGFRLFIDRQKGLFARFHSMPVSHSAILWAHILSSLVSIGISIVIIMIVAFIMGFQSNAGVLEWLMVIAILILFTLALTWIAIIPGLTAKTVDGVGLFSYPLMFLPFLSSAFVPTETMPTFLRIFAENQPVTTIVNVTRSLLSSNPVGNDLWIAIIWCLGIMIVAYFFAMQGYKRLEY